jgi:Tol biopolymer transport system component
LDTVKVINLKASQVTTIPDSEGLLLSLCSPDGRYIAATSVDGQKLKLFDFKLQKWTDLLKTNVGDISWSRNSKYIYFDAGLSAEPAFYSVRVDDRKVERVADFKGFRRVVFGWSPWSGVTPDGAPLLMRDVSTQEVYALDFEAP